MKKLTFLMMLSIFIWLFSGCEANGEDCQIAATTLPVYTFTTEICSGTELKVCQVVTQNVSCLHDYTLQSSQMRIIETAETIVISGAGLEDFLDDALSPNRTMIDASANIALLCAQEDHNHTHGHNHDRDPHVWLSPQNAKIMADNICAGLTAQYPQYADEFSHNLEILTAKLDALADYGTETLSQLSCRELITFHDGFSYFADAFNLSVLKAVEEESGSEASAAELKEIITLVEDHALPAIFTETNGSESAARTICAETNIPFFALDMAMSEGNYFEVMYRNIDTVKEALE